MKILHVAGARPNFMKIAPLLRAFKHQTPTVETPLLHTGQHYDYQMNQTFFDQLEIPTPDISLEVGSATHAVQTAEIMKRLEPVLDEMKPDAVLVVGDVNSTVACALVAAKKHIPVVHVEAGLRSGDRSMPEELNRIVTDQLSDRLYVTEESAIENLLREGKTDDQIVFAGNVMIDTLFWALERAVDPRETLGEAADRIVDNPDGYGLLTLHRPSNVDDPAILGRLLQLLAELGEQVPLVFPVHPRTRAQVSKEGLDRYLEAPGLHAIDPVGYFEMAGMQKGARVVLTDSGGLQEETTALGIPCLTLRENTERPITLEQGRNTLVGIDAKAIRRAWSRALSSRSGDTMRPEHWDGHAANRIASDLIAWLGQDGSGVRKAATA